MAEYQGLSSQEVRRLQQKYGRNELTQEKPQSFLRKALHIASEPMFLLLLGAAAVYFFLGEAGDGVIMLLSVAAIIAIDIVQQWKTDRTLSALKNLSAPQVTVVRDGQEQEIASAELVPGDLMLLHEGVKIPADGSILRCSDLCVDESSLTGESEGVWKTPADPESSTGDYWRRDFCYAGTLVVQGSVAVRVEKTGEQTEYGKIGAAAAQAPEEETPLQKQTAGLVRLCAGIAGALFALVGLVTWLNLHGQPVEERLVQSVLSGITLAMALIPEEFPVILTVFLSMGAWRLARKNSLVRRLPAVETLGSVSVLCVDKTGTITLNHMTVQETWAADGDEAELCETMGLACESETYDPMEKAMLKHCERLGISRRHLFQGALIDEYAFTNELKMMGHVWRHEGELLIAAKGSPEKILTLCEMPDTAREEAETRAAKMAGEGLRVIAVASGRPVSEQAVPGNITECRLELRGLIGLADPPRESVAEDIAVCSRAGIRVIMITGDNGVTASAIARKVGIPNADKIITGEMLDAMDEQELRRQVQDTGVFSRVTPEHKMRIVGALRENGEITAMTGDGVNDAPALKNADIGVAMGKRGSEVAREAADLILMDDNFSTIVQTVRDGRRIYDNIRRAVGYVFTIHIPIALSSLLAPLLGAAPDSLLLLPLHVVLLELIIDPTCSVVLERQPAEEDIMRRPPRAAGEKLLDARTLAKSVLQGLAVFAASFGLYWFLLSRNPAGAATARSAGLSVLILSNLFLVQVNSSHIDSVLHAVRRLARDRVMWIVTIATPALLLVLLYTPLAAFLRLAPLSAGCLLLSAALSIAAVLWYELVKLRLRRKRNKTANHK